jgi:hypothetical protein
MARRSARVVVAGTLILGAVILAPTASAESCKYDNNERIIPNDRADYDGDGMSNYAENNFGICPGLADTDHDGLTDPQEVHQYNTGPWMKDTDGDGSSDRYEIDGGTDPLVNDNATKTAPPPVQAPAPEPEPAPAPAPEPCIPDPFDLNFPGAC